jgi:indole-3-glycerol phosphate synthase
MEILEKIIAKKKSEVSNNKSLKPIALLEQSIFFDSTCVSLTSYIQRADKSGIIAEFKRKSPSKPEINLHADVESVSIGYMQAGASALSVLTDESFFGGKNADLGTARKFNYCPILRKDFIIDEYQIIEAKSIGADAILLIAECLEKEELAQLAKTANSLGLEVLMELHSADQLEKVNQYVNAVGVNNRNLKTFVTDIKTSLDIVSSIPDDFCKISESGISDPLKVVELKQAGFEGFLIGEHFMSNANPGKACSLFVEQINRYLKPKGAEV